MPEDSPFGSTALAKVRRTIQAHDMLHTGSRVLVGVSGGPDSVALLRLLLELRREYDLFLAVGHVNHCLRDEASLRDEAFVREVSGRFHLPFHVERVDVKQWADTHGCSLETAGRKVRYGFFRVWMKRFGYDTTALGHHRDDNAEQVLMNLIRGSGMKGLAGIPAVRDGWIIRPLIRLPKTDILADLKQRDQPYVMDESNTDTAFFRNRIRYELLPLLERAYNPGVRSALDRLSGIIQEEETWMQSEAQAVFNRLARRTGEKEVWLSRAGLVDMPPALARRVLRCALMTVKGDLKRISAGHIDNILTLNAEKRGRKNLDMPGRIRVTLTRTRLYLTRSACSLRQLKPLDRPDR